MGLEERLRQDLKEAIKRGETTKRNAIRSIINAINYAQIEKQASLQDPDILELISKEVKRHRESIEAFAKGERSDLVAQEEAELQILLAYLPQQLSKEEIADLARKVIAEVGAQGPKDKGKVMGRLMPQLKGRAEGREVSQLVDELLSQV
jgi:hypothetical protein